MLHTHLRGTHYAMGYDWGHSLARKGHLILEHTPLAPDKARVAYAAACLPIYEKHFPAVLAEMRGFADGQGCDTEEIAAVLWSMYALPPARAIVPGMNAGMLLRRILETCATVREALAFLKSAPIGSAQTLTLADARGEIAVVECDALGMAVVRPQPGQPWVCATNAFHDLPATPPPDGDDWFAQQRYETLVSALRESAPADAAGAQALLAGRRGFLCQYDRAEGRDTVWSVVYDLGRREIFRAEGNPARIPFERDHRFAL